MSSVFRNVLVAVMTAIVLGVLGTFGFMDYQNSLTHLEGRCQVNRSSSSSYLKTVRTSHSRRVGNRRETYYTTHTETRYVVYLYYTLHAADNHLYQNTYRFESSSSADARNFQDKYRSGSSYQCWYDPTDPQTVDLDSKIHYGSLAVALGGGLGSLGTAIGTGWVMMFRRKRQEAEWAAGAPLYAAPPMSPYSTPPVESEPGP
jgi:hypothetical protein